MSETRWGHASHPDAETWEGSFATRDEAVADGRERYEGEAFYVRSGTRLRAAEHLPRWLFGNLVEGIEENAFEACGLEDDVFDVTPGAEEALRRAVGQWADEHLTTDKWVADGPDTELVSEEDEVSRRPYAAPAVTELGVDDPRRFDPTERKHIEDLRPLCTEACLDLPDDHTHTLVDGEYVARIEAALAAAIARAERFGEALDLFFSSATRAHDGTAAPAKEGAGK